MNAEAPMVFTESGIKNAAEPGELLSFVQFANAFVPTVSSLDGRRTSVSEGQLAKAEAPSEVIVDGISMVERFVQPSKLEAGIMTTPSSDRMVTRCRLVRTIPDGRGTAAPSEIAVIGHFRKALIPMFFAELGILMSSGFAENPSLVQPSKAEAPIVVRVGGRAATGREAQFRNADAPSDWSLEGKLMVARATQPENAKSPITVISSGRVTEVSLENPSNFLAGRVVSCGDSRTSWMDVTLCLSIPAGMGAELPMVSAVMAVLLKASSPIVLTEFGILTESMAPDLPSCVQDLNAAVSIVESRGGREMLRRDEHPRNADAPIRTSLERLGKVTEDRDEQFSKALSLMSVT